MFPIRDANPSATRPVVTWALIAANLVVFGYELTLSPPELERFFSLVGLVPRDLATGEASASTLVSSMFLHGGWFHVLSNVWFLHLFGDNVEDRMGHLRYALFYLLVGVGAGLTHLFTNLGSVMPTVGASGAIAGVMGAYIHLFPRARITAFVPLGFYPVMTDVSALLFLGLWFGLQFFSGIVSLGQPADVGGIAFWAHAGGFAAGWLAVRIFAPASRAGRRGPPRLPGPR